MSRGRSIRPGAALLAILAGTALAPLPAQDAPDPDKPAAPPVDTDRSPLHLALLDYKRGNYEAARTAIEAAEKAHPGDVPTGLLHARILIELHDYAAGETVLRQLIEAAAPVEAQVTLGDLYLRKHDFAAASEQYGRLLPAKGGDPDLLLKLVYAKVSASDFVSAGRYASQLKPLDADHPAYYFAQAALAHATGKASEAEQNIETARTIYGNTLTDRYLKTYLEVIEGKGPTDLPTTKSPATNVPPAAKK